VSELVSLTKRALLLVRDIETLDAAYATAGDTSVLPKNVNKSERAKKNERRRLGNNMGDVLKN